MQKCQPLLQLKSPEGLDEAGSIRRYGSADGHLSQGLNMFLTSTTLESEV